MWLGSHIGRCAVLGELGRGRAAAPFPRGHGQDCRRSAPGVSARSDMRRASAVPRVPRTPLWPSARRGPPRPAAAPHLSVFSKNLYIGGTGGTVGTGLTTYTQTGVSAPRTPYGRRVPRPRGTVDVASRYHIENGHIASSRSPSAFRAYSGGVVASLRRGPDIVAPRLLPHQAIAPLPHPGYGRPAPARPRLYAS
jgi:hypothetical protein